MALADSGKAVGAVTRLLQDHLIRRGFDVSIGKPEEAANNNSNEKLNLFLYETAFDPQLRNLSLRDGEPPPLWLVLKYLLTAFDVGESSDTAAAHDLLGRGMSALHELGFLPLDPLVAPDVRLALEHNPEPLKLSFDEASADLLADCLVPPGTPIPLLTVNRVVTERGGIVTARVTQDVWDAGFACLAVPAGSVVTLDVGSGVTKGQKRIEVTNPMITRPWPRNDTVRVVAVGADIAGAAGLAGSVEVPWLQTGLLIAASTAVDVAAAALTGGGSLIGGILGHSIDRPLDKAAKDLLDRAPVIMLNAGEPVLLLLRGSLKADDFDRAR